MDTVGGRGPIVACNEGVIQKKGRAPLNLAPIKVLLRVNTIERYESVRGSRTNGGREGGREEGRKEGRNDIADSCGSVFSRRGILMGAITQGLIMLFLLHEGLRHAFGAAPSIVIIYEAYKGGGGGGKRAFLS